MSSIKRAGHRRRPAAAGAFNDADVAFAQGMIPHHEQAVEMSTLAADTVSIAVMEIVENSIIALTSMDAHLSDGLFWYALLGGFAVAFLITTPVNKWMIGRGKGHAVVHSLH